MGEDSPPVVAEATIPRNGVPWSIVAIGSIVLLVGLLAFVWNTHLVEFRRFTVDTVKGLQEVKKEITALRVLIQKGKK